MAKKQKRNREDKVVRIPKDLKDYLSGHREKGESWGAVIKRLLHERPDEMTMWTLPSKLLPSRAEARGLAIREAVEEGADLGAIEEPIEVYEFRRD